MAFRSALRRRVLAAVLLLAAALPMMTAPAWSQAPVEDLAERRFTVAEVRADFDDLYRGMQAAHYDLYVHTPKAAYDKAWRRMRAGFDRPMTKAEAATAFQEFLALGKVAHARIDLPAEPWSAFREGGGRAFPISLRIVGGRAYVDRNFSGVDTLRPGDEITHLDGRPMAVWLSRTGRLISADTPALLHSLIEFEFPRLLWQEIGARDRFELRLRKTDGRRFTVAVPAITRTEWIAAEAGQPARFEVPGGREARMLAGGVGYLRPGPFYNFENTEDLWSPAALAAFQTFLDRAFADFISRGATDLIVDLRDNPGGDNSFSDPLVAWFADKPFRFASDFRIRVSAQTTASNQARLDAPGGDQNDASHRLARLYQGAAIGSIVHYDIPTVQPREGQRFTGRVWMLVNRRSYSNTVNVAALAQDYGFATIIGEPTTDMATTFGAMEQFTLPRTGIVAGYPKAHIIRPSGALESAGVTPDIPIETPIVPAATDVVLARALEIVSKRRVP